MQDPIQEITKAKNGWGVAQVVEHLPSKCKVLSSNFGTAKKKKSTLILYFIIFLANYISSIMNYLLKSLSYSSFVFSSLLRQDLII
jgi:hypothetical protein